MSARDACTLAVHGARPLARVQRLVARQRCWTAAEMCATAAHSGRSRRAMVQSLHTGRPMASSPCHNLLRHNRRTMAHGSAALVAAARGLVPRVICWRQPPSGDAPPMS
ncbi:hypothetical protein F511_33464 [Dorcoceras hygrometricum]|uniref:Uncharacterized protein n=1 Tax=Dorcoceras hygrometricum TaxID=472368 RepID=A0A2Z7ATA0_9LAMI|nr:hypothetical protein F511_33464 [Dorcoceras hygrometricum]